ncbi:conserved hypothetical protein [Vibrio nigripulchritudo SFn118]|nr:conserved hypothetical protein [Vibrio nigripulchritudo SFn118]
MAIKTGCYLDSKDVYIDYPFEEVMFRRMKSSLIYKKFYGESESKNTVSSCNRLFNDALLYGVEISKEDYDRGA